MKPRTFFANMICGVIPCKKTRDIVRIKIKYHKYVNYCINFALAHIYGTNHKIKIDVGARSNNLVLLVDKLCVFKFPLHDNGYDKAIREKRIIDTFSKISPIKIPKIKLYKWGDIMVRKYEFTDGVTLKQIPLREFYNHRTKIAAQLARFIYEIGIYDPVNLQDLKQNANIRPGFLRGWFHNDIAENFIINPKTFDITGFIDWEDAAFVDFNSGLDYARKNWNKHGFANFMDDVLNAYSTLYKKSGKLY